MNSLGQNDRFVDAGLLTRSFIVKNVQSRRGFGTYGTAVIACGIFGFLMLFPSLSHGDEATIGIEQVMMSSKIAAHFLGQGNDLAETTLIYEVLTRNPDLLVMESLALAEMKHIPQAGVLPDPMVSITAYPQSPETRVGPQQAMLGISQKFPWFGKLKLREKVAEYNAAVAGARLEAKRLSLITETRRLYYELGFTDIRERILRSDREVLLHYEELARSRYASGVGLEQVVVKLQAEITRDETRLSEIAIQRASIMATLNSLRNEPVDRLIAAPVLPEFPELTLNAEVLHRTALESRPELTEMNALIGRAETLRGIAVKEYDPDITLGMAYTFVGNRTDEAGRTMPPPDNGKDILGISATVSIPLWRDKLAAGVDEAAERQAAAIAQKNAVITTMYRDIGDLLQRIPLTWDQMRLQADVLTVQASESFRSAEAGYAAGTIKALDLLDAERTLLDVQIATARTRTDYAQAIVRLEGTIGAPIPLLEIIEMEGSK